MGDTFRADLRRPGKLKGTGVAWLRRPPTDMHIKPKPTYMRKRTGILFLFLGLLCGIGTAQAQGRKSVTGVVRDASGVGLSGASVAEKGSRNSVLTDESGKFSISVPSSANLVISFVGFVSKTIPVTGSDLNILLESGTNNLDEVVVTSLGIGKKQKALGYAVSTITATQLTDAGTPNFATALYGKAPGVRIGATPGGATSAVNINIRGINSITGKNQPLIVLNGVPIRNQEVSNDNYWGDQRVRGNGLLDIQTEDIDNISILKGASAAALYGSEAVNGVVLITTKSGVREKKGLGVDFNATYGVENVAFLPRYQNVRGYAWCPASWPTSARTTSASSWSTSTAMVSGRPAPCPTPPSTTAPSSTASPSPAGTARSAPTSHRVMPTTTSTSRAPTPTSTWP